MVACNRGGMVNGLAAHERPRYTTLRESPEVGPVYVTIRKVGTLWRVTLFCVPARGGPTQIEFLTVRDRAACIAWLAAIL